MSKTKKIKVDYDDTSEILDIIVILKDIATTHFQHSAKKKQILIDFVSYFIDFFKIASFVGKYHYLVEPKATSTAILAITSESAFMGDMNSRMTRQLLAEAEKNNSGELIIVGNKAGEKIRQMIGETKNVHIFGNIEQTGIYKISVMVTEFIIKSVLEEKFGRILSIYPFAININLIRPKTAALFPSKELFTEQTQEQGSELLLEPVIVESEVDAIMGYLASLWLTCRIYELMMNAECSGYAAQAQQLEGASDRLKKEKLFLATALKKSKKADISKSLAEVFAARMVNIKM